MESCGRILGFYCPPSSKIGDIKDSFQNIETFGGRDESTCEEVNTRIFDVLRAFLNFSGNPEDEENLK